MFMDRSSAYQWMCSFDDRDLTQHFEGFEDKRVVGLGGYDMDKFFDFNEVVSGKTILVMSTAEVLYDVIIVDIDQVIALEEDKTQAYLPVGAATQNLSRERPRLRYPNLVTISEIPESRFLSPSISVDSFNLRSGKPIVKVGAPNTEVYNLPVTEDTSSSNRRRLAPTLGSLNALVVRVNALDNSPPPAADLSEDIFGDEWCLKSQMARCSYNKLTIQEYVPGNGISSISTAAPGVVDVNVNINAVGNTYSQLQIDANAATRELFGVSRLDSLFDIVMFVSSN